MHTSWGLFIVLNISIPVLPIHRIKGAHLSTFSRISAMLVSGFRRWCLRLCCSRGRQVFHCAVHSTWMVVGLPRRMARCSILSSLFVICSCSYKGHIEWLAEACEARMGSQTWLPPGRASAGDSSQGKWQIVGSDISQVQVIRLGP